MISLMFLIYLLIVLRFKVDTILLIVITNPLWSAQIKLAIISDLIFLSFLLILATCLLDRTINLLQLIKFMRTITCFLDGPFIVILILGFSFFYLFMILYIYLLDKFGKFSLILMMLLMLFLEAWTYKWPLLVEVPDKDVLLL